MSQRKALIASLVITLVLALSAIGIRAAIVDSPQSQAESTSGLTLVEPGGDAADDSFESSEDNEFEDSEDDHSDDDDENNHDNAEDNEREEDADDD